MESWLQVALLPQVVRRAVKTALVVGAILIVINHGDAIVTGLMTPERWLKAVLTLLVPYCVSTYAAVGAIRDSKI